MPVGSDFANGTLMCKHGDYYLSVTTYQVKETKPVPKGQIGIDFGLSRQLTLTGGIGIQYSIPTTQKLRRLCRKLSKQKKHSKNWYKTIIKLNKSMTGSITLRKISSVRL
jgi:putative transposase